MYYKFIRILQVE